MSEHITPEAMSPDTAELLPCPFCANSRPRVVQHNGGSAILCKWGDGGCDVMTPAFEDEARAIAAWNRRPAPDAQATAEDVERVREALEPFTRQRVHKSEDGAAGVLVSATVADVRRAKAVHASLIAAATQGREAPTVPDERICTCHPDDKPSGECPRKFAASECQAATQGRAPTVPADLLALLEALPRGPYHVEWIDDDGEFAVCHPETQCPGTVVLTTTSEPVADALAALVNWFDTLPSSDVGAVKERDAAVAWLRERSDADDLPLPDSEKPSDVASWLAYCIERGDHLSPQPENGGR